MYPQRDVIRGDPWGKVPRERETTGYPRPNAVSEVPGNRLLLTHDSDQACCLLGSPPLQEEPIALDKQHSRDSTAITHSTYSLPASAYSQDPVYVNGGLNYSYRGYGSLSSNLQPSASLQTGNHSNGKSESGLVSRVASSLFYPIALWKRKAMAQLLC